MQLLLFSDVHCHLGVCRRIVEKADEVDVVIGAGDFANVRSGLEATIAILREISKPTVLVPGNNESFAELQKACKGWSAATLLHGSSANIEGMMFFGIGGGIPVTPFGSWSYDFTEKEASEMLAKCPEKAILVSHSPPRGVVDVSSSGKSLGSTAVREAVFEKKPRLVVCGHIHASAGKWEMLAETPVVNAGSEGMFWHIP